MFFKTPAHRARFLAAIQQMDCIDRGKLDPEYGAALYILTSGLAIYEKAQPYIKHNGHKAIQFDELLAETNFAHSEEILVSLAGNLFNGNTAVSPVDFVILDSGNFAAVQEALRIRYEAPRIEDIGHGIVVEGGK